MAATGEGSSSSLGSTELALARPVDLDLARHPLSPASPSFSSGAAVKSVRSDACRASWIRGGGGGERGSLA
ncbi:unnamed protein product [Urochloa humidicola]